MRATPWSPRSAGLPPPTTPTPRTYDTANIIVAWLDLPADTGEDRRGWRSAPTGAALPERFILTAYAGDADPIEAIGAPIANPLYVGPDPNAPPEDRIAPQDGKLIIPDPLKWMFDFD